MNPKSLHLALPLGFSNFASEIGRPRFRAAQLPC
jgi:hypothetical protein